MDSSDSDNAVTARNNHPSTSGSNLVCLNKDCEKAKGPFADEVPKHVLSYFRVRRKKNQKVCQRCFKTASDYFDKLNNKLQNKESMFEVGPPPKSNKIVLDLEENSDDEEISPTESMSDDTKELVKKFVISICDKNKDKIDFQIAKGIEQIQKDIDEIEESRNKRMEMMDNDMKILNEFIRLKECELERTIAEGGIISEDNDDDDVVEISMENESSSSEDLGTTMDLEIVSEQRLEPPGDFPERGILRRTLLTIGSNVLTMIGQRNFKWIEGKVLTVVRACKRHAGGVIKCGEYEVEIDGKQFFKAEGKYLAFTTPPQVVLRVGVRVVGLISYDESSERAFYSGTVAESATAVNLFRYLIFFDSGLCRYVGHNDLRVICEPSINPWIDVPFNKREFIEKYFRAYPDRSMVKLQVNDEIKVKNGDLWMNAKVKTLDVSMVEIKFNNVDKTEWIYRGSPKLKQIYLSMQDKSTGRIRRRPVEDRAPYIEYTHEESSGSHTGDDIIICDKDDGAATSTTTTSPRATARKSTSSRRNNATASTSTSRSNVTPLRGKFVEKGKGRIIPKRYNAHICSSACVSWTVPHVMNFKNLSQIAMPLYYGFRRMMMSHNTEGTRVYSIVYQTPCGRKLRFIEEALSYLRMTNSELTIDCFDFDHWVRCLTEYIVDPKFIKIEDISKGLERNPIQCVNQYDSSRPNFYGYMTKRMPRLNVGLNTDKEFLCGCNCTDDCKDKSKCACCQLTIEGQNVIPGNPIDPDAGYRFRRLADQVLTGIYECNDQCKCSRSCLNRVVQFPISQRLQLFKTKKKGWGIRCLNDIPKGAYICSYVGHMLTDQTANEEGRHFGDEYFADLDFIESIEVRKPGYESHVSDLSEEDDMEYSRFLPADVKRAIKDSSSESGSSSDGININIPLEGNRRQNVRYKFRDRNKINRNNKKTGHSSNRVLSSSESEEENTNKKDTKALKSQNVKWMPTRSYYGPNEKVYIMDAKTSGNIGRYLNHSCDPNIFVQNVFVDTHDLRFPWITFFSKKYIEAGTELTWDYNYQVGCVEGKVLYCYCGSNNCRGRLL